MKINRVAEAFIRKVRASGVDHTYVRMPSSMEKTCGPPIHSLHYLELGLGLINPKVDWKMK